MLWLRTNVIKEAIKPISVRIFTVFDFAVNDATMRNVTMGESDLEAEIEKTKDKNSEETKNSFKS